VGALYIVSVADDGVTLADVLALGDAPADSQLASASASSAEGAQGTGCQGGTRPGDPNTLPLMEATPPPLVQ